MAAVYVYAGGRFVPAAAYVYSGGSFRPAAVIINY